MDKLSRATCQYIFPQKLNLINNKLNYYHASITPNKNMSNNSNIIIVLIKC